MNDASNKPHELDAGGTATCIFWIAAVWGWENAVFMLPQVSFNNKVFTLFDSSDVISSNIFRQAWYNCIIQNPSPTLPTIFYILPPTCFRRWITLRASESARIWAFKWVKEIPGQGHYDSPSGILQVALIYEISPWQEHRVADACWCLTKLPSELGTLTSKIIAARARDHTFADDLI